MAQVAITALALEDLSFTHWMARALFLIGEISGCLSIYYACMLQTTISSGHRPDRVSSWIEIPPEDPIDPTRSKSYEASLAAVFIISTPFKVVKVIIVAFLIGLIIFQAFTWKCDLDTSATPGESRHISISFRVVTGVCIVFFLITFSAKDLEILWRTRNMERATGGVHLRALPEIDTTTQSINKGTLMENPVEINMAALTKPLVKTHQLGRKAAGPLLSHHKQRDPPAEANPPIVAGGVLPADSIASLLKCLDDAAQAHTQCAKADRKVALAYRRPSSTTRTNETAHPSTQDLGRF